MNKMLQGLVNKLRSNNNSEVKIEYPDDHYEITKDPKENLLKFEDAMEMIKEKHKAYNFEAAFKEKFGEELSPDDFQYPERIGAYCIRNNVSKEELNEFKRERLKIREIGNRKVFEFVTHAEGLLYYRGGVCPDYMLSKLARIEKLYGNKERAAEFNKLLEKARADNARIKEGAKWMLLKDAANSILLNTGPYGKEPVNKEDWGKAIDLVAEKLRARGIDIIEDGHNQEIWESWYKVKEQLSREKNEKFDLEESKVAGKEIFRGATPAREQSEHDPR